MKKTLLIAFIVCKTILIFGQKGFESIGLTVGGNLFRGTDIDEALDFKPNLGTEIGVYWSTKTKEKQRYQGNLVLSNRAINQKAVGFIGNSSGQSTTVILDQRVKVNLIYLSSPNFIAFQLSNKKPIDLLLGIEPSLQLSTRFQSGINSNFLIDNRQISVLGSIGTQVRFKHFFVALKYSHTIWKSEETGFFISNLAILNQGIQMNIGIPFLTKEFFQ